MLDWMVNDKGIEPHVPVWDKSERNDGTLSRRDFQWNEAANEYICPEGNLLKSNWRPFVKPRSHITKADTLIYHARKKDCFNCPMKLQCCPNTPVRKVVRSLYEPARDVARAIFKTEAYKQSFREPWTTYWNNLCTAFGCMWLEGGAFTSVFYNQRIVSSSLFNFPIPYCHF